MTSETLEKRLEQHPELKAQLEEILEMIESPLGKLDTLDEFEEKAVEALSEFGKECLSDWANHKSNQMIKQTKTSHLEVRNGEKKVNNLYNDWRARYRGASAAYKKRKKVEAH